jgi:small subunit ribosomal protein S17
MKKQGKEKVVEVDKSSCADVTCPVHSKLKVRGRSFKGYIVKKFPRRIVIEFERIVYIRKYERYTKKRTRIHARLPSCMRDKVEVGDYVLVGGCRPLSKLIHFVLLKKVKETGGERK